MDPIIISFLVTATALSAIFLAIHLGFRAPRRIEKGNPADFGLPYRETGIHTRRGKNLFAWWLPAATPAPTIILLHGWGGNAELMLPLALPLPHAGLNVLLLDARNHGRSDSASFSSLPRFAEDVAPMYTACRVKCQVLLVHGTADKTIPLTDALAIRNNCIVNSLELLLIENADHESVEEIEEHGDQLIAFLTRVGVVD